MSAQRFRYRHLIRGKLIEPEPDTGGVFAKSERTDTEADVYELGGVQNGVGTVDEIDELVRRGQLTPHDLVDLGQGWESIENRDEFEAASAPALRRERLVLMAKCAGAGLVGLLAAWARMGHRW